MKLESGRRKLMKGRRGSLNLVSIKDRLNFKADAALRHLEKAGAIETDVNVLLTIESHAVSKLN